MSPFQGGQAVRSLATGRLRRGKARMTLSRDVAKSSLKSKREDRGRIGPFSNMNQTQARVRDDPRSRSAAALRRSGDTEEKPATKTDSPLYKALKMQTTLAPISYGRRTAIKAKIAEITSFDVFPLLPIVRNSIYSQALPHIPDAVPTPIQRVAIPRLLEDAPVSKKLKKVDDEKPNYPQYLLAAETGSGKTLAYLIPVIDAIKRQEALDKEIEKEEEEKKAREREENKKNQAFDLEPEIPPLSNAGRPRAIILVPTAELVAQVGAKVKAFAHTVKFRSGTISSNLTPRRIKSTLFNPAGIDVLVSTPHLLASIAKTDPYVLSRVSHLVLDEADSLMDRSFRPTTTEIISKVSPSLKKLIFCSATIPRSLDTQLRDRYPDIWRLTTPNLHAIPRRVQLGVVDIQKDPYRGNRNLACADVIWSIGKGQGDDEPIAPWQEPRVKKILVFVNEREEADEVAQFLKSKGIDAHSFSRDSGTRNQEEVLAEFTEPTVIPSADEILLARKQKKRDSGNIPFVLPERTAQGPERLLQGVKVLVTTDIASRGIDTIAVKTLVLYHVPHTTIDFIHRLGRLGRMGKRGRAVVLVGKKDRKDVVKEVREAMFRGQALI
ncbi:ATP-dependent RNA helicase MRH4 [Aspergillus mulundensis]|uniref:RNA helicase n=1 Tax=Aspergillus mulundensis TaxID=1810919 RepID=A0A3D8SVZ7_9EURO|nr:ATP-dependent RNA helicase mrh4, mitochondrial [Aspergillus mulundensis]RDW90497.1 ATP-dependent RNA helicase mrh4, mitochondrial [Aspergillus mulundensis]